MRTVCRAKARHAGRYCTGASHDGSWRSCSVLGRSRSILGPSGAKLAQDARKHRGLARPWTRTFSATLSFGWRMYCNHRTAEESRGRRHFQKMSGGVIFASRMLPGSCTAADCAEAVLRGVALGTETRQPPETCSSVISSSACIPFRLVRLSFIVTSLCRGNVRLRLCCVFRLPVP